MVDRTEQLHVFLYNIQADEFHSERASNDVQNNNNPAPHEQSSNTQLYDVDN